MTKETLNPLVSAQKQLKEACERLGMIIDVSHLNDEGFYDEMKFAKGPAIASYSNCRELKKSMRNLTDDQIKCRASCNAC